LAHLVAARQRSYVRSQVLSNQLSGTIRFGSQLVGVSSVVLPPNKRGTGYVPQQGALFPHLNVAKNISFGLDRELYKEADLRDNPRDDWAHRHARL
jgi:ABC-type Fe3+/spermidine/putrescine transport system ATPase subunit